MKYTFFSHQAKQWDPVPFDQIFKDYFKKELGKKTPKTVAKILGKEFALSWCSIGGTTGPFSAINLQEKYYFFRVKAIAYYKMNDLDAKEFYNLFNITKEKHIRIIKKKREIEQKKLSKKWDMERLAAKAKQETLKREESKNKLDNDPNDFLGKEFILFKEHSNDYDIEFLVEFKEEQIIFNYWLINDRYEKEKFLYVDKGEWNNLFKVFEVGNQSALVEKLKFNYGEPAGFSNFEKILVENKINFSINRNYNEP